MSKAPNSTDQILNKIISKEYSLNPTALKVFLSWFTDKIDFDASTSMLVLRIGIRRDKVNQGMKDLCKKKILKRKGSAPLHTGDHHTNYYTYELHPDFLNDLKKTAPKKEKSSP